MNLPQEIRDELKAKVEASELRSEAKAEILALLEKEDISPEDALRIGDLIEDDIAEDIDEVPGLADALMKSGIYESLEEETAAIAEESRKEIAELDSFVGEQMAVLDAAEAELLEAERQIKIGETKKNLENT